MNRLFYALIATCALAITFSCTRPANKPNDTYLIVLSMDGFRWDYPDRYPTPNLNAMALNGVKAVSFIPPFPTLTFPSHYAMATGLYPDHHGIVGNTFFDSVRNELFMLRNRHMVEDTFYFGAEAAWETAKKQGIKTASYYWVGSEVNSTSKSPDIAKKFDASVPFEDRIDSVVAWLSLPEATRPSLIWFYFEEPDAIGHSYGPVSEETGKKVAYLDSLVGVLRLKTSSLPLASKLNLMVVSDHGMGDLDSARFLSFEGTLKDEWISYIAGHSPFYLIEPEKGFADSILNTINASGRAKAWTRDAISAVYPYGSNYRIPGIVVLADSGWTISFESHQGRYLKGAHGFAPENTDMHGIFYAEGPAFKKNYLHPSFENVNLYLMVSRVMGFKPAAGDGNPENFDQLFLK
jgi:alkaline phosphatase D